MVEQFFHIDPSIARMAEEAEETCREAFARIDGNAEYNGMKVLSAFIENNVSESHFAGTTGYGYDDRGREVLDRVLARVMGAEDALIRHNFVSGTHAITTALFGVLRPGDRMVSLTGLPYDTLQPVIGIVPGGHGSLKEFGIRYEQLDLLPDGSPDYARMADAVKGARMAYLQRSRGYSLRESLSVAQIERIAGIVREANPGALIVVDNCYGEFVEPIEPSDVGADMIVGSLIKNPGGGLAPIGGYICGRTDLVERCAYRLSAPGLGQEVGANLGLLPSLYQGFFLAPTVVASALKGAIFAANLYERLGFRVVPNGSESRHDIIQAVELGSREGMIAFCKGIQSAAPVDSFADPIPSDMPGYEDEVIMAAGAFVQGSSIELSADGPIRPPYAVYFQGGLTWYHAKLGILLSLQNMADAGLATLPEVQ